MGVVIRHIVCWEGADGKRVYAGIPGETGATHTSLSARIEQARHWLVEFAARPEVGRRLRMETWRVRFPRGGGVEWIERMGTEEP